MNRWKFNKRWIEINEKRINDQNRREDELLQIRREELFISRKRSEREAIMLSEERLKKYIRDLLTQILGEDDELIEEGEK